MPPPFTVRRLGPGDVDLLRALNAMFGRAFRDEDAYSAAPRGERSAASVLDREHVVVLVALEGREVAGGLTAYGLDKLESQAREYYLYDLAVREESRRRGIATALISRLRDVAREGGAGVVLVQADPGDDPAIALYGKLGIREDVLHFDISTEPDR